MPQRFSKEQFDVYEPLIQAAVYVLPSRYTIDTPWMGYAQATVSRNLREAIQALHTHRWPSSVDMPKFLQYFSNIEVATEPKQVIVRLRSRGQRATPEASVQCQNTIHFAKPPEPPVIKQLIDLCNAGLILGLRLHNTGMTAEAVEQLTAFTNIGVLQQDDAIVLI